MTESYRDNKIGAAFFTFFKKTQQLLLVVRYNNNLYVIHEQPSLGVEKIHFPVSSKMKREKATTS